MHEAEFVKKYAIKGGEKRGGRKRTKRENLKNWEILDNQKKEQNSND